MPGNVSVQYVNGMRREEVRAVLSEVNRFVRSILDPLTRAPEAPMSASALDGAMREADARGLVSGTETSGLGPWEELDHADPPVLTLAVLSRLGRANAGFALAVHLRALGRALRRRAGLDSEVVVLPEGAVRLGRTALPRLVARSTLLDEDRAVLSDCYAASAARVVPFDGHGLATPIFDGERLRFQLHVPDQLSFERAPDAHGLDELSFGVVRPVGAASAQLDLDVTPFFAAHQLALAAIALGAVERAHDLAKAFASRRWQGGATIDRHPAVLGLLGKTRLALTVATAQIELRGRRPLDDVALFEAISARAGTMPMLTEGAHAALQVFGGLGYMRDVGLEKVTRDVNCLRVMAGAPPELTLIAAEWERLHA